jgi:integrase/recombinase XerD
MKRNIALDQLLNRFPLIADLATGRAWLELENARDCASNTLLSYGNSLEDFLRFCVERGVNPEQATALDIGRYKTSLRQRPVRSKHTNGRVYTKTGLGEGTIKTRCSALRSYFRHLVYENVRVDNPLDKLKRSLPKWSAKSMQPKYMDEDGESIWLPSEAQWERIVAAVQSESLRNRCMFALQYEGALRSEELSLAEVRYFDMGAHKLTLPKEITKNKKKRTLPFSPQIGDMLAYYWLQRAALDGQGGRVWRSESRRNRHQPITVWTWFKVVEQIARRANVPEFHPHTLRHLRLTDLARSGFHLLDIMTFAGHAQPATTMHYIHLSGRDIRVAEDMSLRPMFNWRLEQMMEVLAYDVPK